MKAVAIFVIVTAAGIWVLGWWMDFQEARANTIPMDQARRRELYRLQRQQQQTSHDIEMNWIG